MSREELRQWAPWALDNLQPAKRLLLIAANIVTAAALLQFLGVDIEAVTQGKITPPVPWWGTAIAAILLVGLEGRISNHQETRLREKVGATQPPPSP